MVAVSPTGNWGTSEKEWTWLMKVLDVERGEQWNLHVQRYFGRLHKAGSSACHTGSKSTWPLFTPIRQSICLLSLWWMKRRELQDETYKWEMNQCVLIQAETPTVFLISTRRWCHHSSTRMGKMSEDAHIKTVCSRTAQTQGEDLDLRYPGDSVGRDLEFWLQRPPRPTHVGPNQRCRITTGNCDNTSIDEVPSVSSMVRELFFEILPSGPKYSWLYHAEKVHVFGCIKYCDNHPV